MKAAKFGHSDVVDLLLRHGAQVQHEDQVIRGKGLEGTRVGEGRCMLRGIFAISVSVPG